MPSSPCQLALSGRERASRSMTATASWHDLTAPAKLRGYCLRGWGVLMASETHRAHDSEMRARTFISYSRKDKLFVDRLDAALKLRGIESLIDREEIYAFEDWWKRIEALIGGA